MNYFELAVECQEGDQCLTGLLLTFSTGERKLYDVSPLLDLPVFQPLKDNRVFDDVQLDFDTVTWCNGDVDIAPETLYHGVEVVVITENEDTTYEQELTADVLSIITVFSAKLYGSRSHKNKQVVDASRELFKDQSTTEEA